MKPLTHLLRWSAAWLCAAAMALPLAAWAGFTNNNDGTVTDTTTGLIWDKCARGATWTAATNKCAGTPSQRNWQDALKEAVQANNARHLGQTDWRVPNRTELESLVLIDKPGVAIDTVAFPDTTPSTSFATYWTSTPVFSTFAGPGSAWDVVFSAGYTGITTMTTSNMLVRLVRGGQPPAAFDLLTPPVLTGVSVIGTTDTGVSLVGTSDQAATGYWVVVPQGSAAPTAAQVKAGQNAAGGAAVSAGNGPMSAGASKTFPVSGLSIGAAYTVYLVAYNSGQSPSGVSSANLTTATPGICGDPRGGTALLTSAPTVNLCSAGTASAVLAGTTSWSWSCTGDSSGGSSSCQVPRGYTVTTSAGANGTVSAGQIVAYNGSASFTVSPSAGYVVDAVTGSTCSVSTTDNVTYQTGPVTSDCTVTATFKQAPVNGICGSAQGTVLLAAAPTAGLCSSGTPTSVTGGTNAWTWTCTGDHGGGANSCQTPRGYTVIASAGPNGSINPSGSQLVAYQSTHAFVLTPDADYVLDTATGCGGSVSGKTFTTGAITGDCAVSASFKSSIWNLTLPEGPQTGAPLAVKPAAGTDWQVTAASTATVASLGAPALPAGVTLPHGVVNLRLEYGAPGTATTVVLTYPQPLPAGAVYYKYGPTADDAQAHWYAFSGAQISGDTVTLTLQDGGAGDDDLAQNRVIQDPGGVALVTAVPVPVPVPTLGQWMGLLLTGLLAGVAAVPLRLRARRA